MVRRVAPRSANQAENWGKSTRNRTAAPSLNDEILQRNHANRVRREAPQRRREAAQADAASWDRGHINRARDLEQRHNQNVARREGIEAARSGAIDAWRIYNEAVEAHLLEWWEVHGATYGYSVDAALPHWEDVWETAAFGRKRTKKITGKPLIPRLIFWHGGFSCCVWSAGEKGRSAARHRRL